MQRSIIHTIYYLIENILYLKYSLSRLRRVEIAQRVLYEALNKPSDSDFFLYVLKLIQL